MTEENMNEYPTCAFCGKSDKTVCERYCGFQSEINDIEYLEIICDECEQKSLR